MTLNTSGATPPTVSITAPAGATVSGTAMTVAATASDNVGVAGVQFKLDGTNPGAEDTTSPYSVTWNSTTELDAFLGAHAATLLRPVASRSPGLPVAVRVQVRFYEIKASAAGEGI